MIQAVHLTDAHYFVVNFIIYIQPNVLRRSLLGNPQTPGIELAAMRLGRIAGKCYDADR